MVREALEDEGSSPLFSTKGEDEIDSLAVSIHQLIERVKLRKADEPLWDSYKTLDEIIDALPDAIFAIDRSGKVIAWNRSMEQLTQVSKGEMIGRERYEYAIPFYGRARPLLIDLALLPDDDY